MLDEQAAAQRPSRALGRLVELARRRQGLSRQELAESSRVDLAEVVAIELGEMPEPEPRALFVIANVLELPPGGLMKLAGLMRTRTESLSDAAVRFAARAEPIGKLSRAEREALEEFVRVLAET